MKKKQTDPELIDRRGQAWIAFATAAISGYIPPTAKTSINLKKYSQLAVEYALIVADEMLEEYQAREDEGFPADEEEEEDEDEEEEDE